MLLLDRVCLNMEMYNEMALMMNDPPLSIVGGKFVHYTAHLYSAALGPAARLLSYYFRPMKPVGITSYTQPGSES